MIYISKGIVQKGSYEHRLRIIKGGQTYTLTGKEASIWLNARYSIAEVHTLSDEKIVGQLEMIGLVAVQEENTALSRYRILTQCVCCPEKGSYARLKGKKKLILDWMMKAGLRLSTAEIIYLMENNIEPCAEMLYVENRQALVETIYCVNNIQDNLLECQMEQASCRDEIVAAILNLLKRKKILIL